MRPRWERDPEIPIDLKTASALMRTAVSGANVHRLEPLRGGRRNTSYRIELDRPSQSGAYVLRLYAHRGNNKWSKEAALWRMLEAEVPMPRVFAATFDRDLFAYPFAIFEFIDGKPLDSVIRAGQAPSDSLLQEIGRTLARVHKHRFGAVGFLDEALDVATTLPALSSWYDMLMGPHGRALAGPATVAEVAACVARHQPSLDELDRDPRLVHGDFRPANLLVRDGRLVAVIDWEDAMAGHWLADIGQFLRDRSEIDDDHGRSFIEGYLAEADHTLPERWKRTMALRDLVNLVQMLESSKGKPVQEAGLIGLIRSILVETSKED